MNKRISDMMDGFTDESVNIEPSEQASSERIKEAVMSKIHNEEKNVRSRRSGSFARIAALAAVFMLVIGGGVVAWASGGLAGFLSLFMPEKEVTERLDTPTENAVTIVQSEGEDFGLLWTIDEYWYDGATLYFTASAPQKVVNAGNMTVEWSDHADVNGTDCHLSADGCWDENTFKYTGRYTCHVDLSGADTSSGNVSLVIRLKLNQYKKMPVFFTVQENNKIDTIAEQELRFDFEKPGDMRQLREERFPIEDGVADISVTVAPSMFNASIVYRMNDSSESVNEIVKYRITDGDGNSTMVWVTGIVKTNYGDDCVVITMTNLDGLDPYSESYTFEPFCFRYDSAGERISDAFDPLEWGGFMVALR